jgi:hypothetical protein
MIELAINGGYPFFRCPEHNRIALSVLFGVLDSFRDRFASPYNFSLILSESQPAFSRGFL